MAPAIGGRGQVARDAHASSDLQYVYCGVAVCKSHETPPLRSRLFFFGAWFPGTGTIEN